MAFVGTLAVDKALATPEQVNLYLPITGTASEGDASAACRYKVTGAGSWTTGHPLYKIRPTLSTTPAVGSVPDAYAWPVIDLEPGTSYDFEVTVTGTFVGSPEVVTLTTTTRSLPAAAGTVDVTITTADSAAQAQTKLDGLTAGQTCQFSNGVYTDYNLDLDGIAGTKGNEIYIRGATEGGVILRRSTAGTVFTVRDADWVVIEDITFRGTGVDAGAGTKNIGILATGSFTQSGITVRRTTMIGVDVGITQSKASGFQMNEWLVYDNILIGNNAWTTVANLDTNVTWNDEGIMLAGYANCAFNNYLEGFGDSLVYAAHSGGATLTDNIGTHFYRNDVVKSCDDFAEIDHAHRNCGCYDNRCTNSMTFSSLDPLYGGPFLFARNISINTGRGMHKWNTSSSGHFFYNNTAIRTTSQAEVLSPGSVTEAGWYLSGDGGGNAQNSYGYRNNILVYRGSGTNKKTIRLDNVGNDPIDWTNNAWYPDGPFQFEGSNHTNLAAALAAQGATEHIFGEAADKVFTGDVITVSNPFVETITLGANYRTEVKYTMHRVDLLPGDNAKNTGDIIPNITDGYTGAAPDMGAAIAGRTAVHYGRSLPSWMSGMALWEAKAIPGTKISDIATADWSEAEIVGSGPSALVWAWTGCSIDPRTSALYFLGSGGHNNYGGNQVISLACAADQPQWVENEPPSINGNEAVEVGYGTDNKPCSSHNYYWSQFDTPRNRALRLAVGSRFGSSGSGMGQGDGFEVLTDVWSTKDTITDPPNVDGSYPDRALCQNPITQDIYLWKNTSFFVWDHVAQTWGSSHSAENEWGHAAVYDRRRNRVVAFPGPGTGSTGEAALTMVIDTWVSAQHTITGDASDELALASTGTAATFYQHPTDSTLDAYIIRLRQSSGAEFYSVNAVTFVATLLATTGASTIPTDGHDTDHKGPYTRMIEAPRLGGILYVVQYDDNVWFLKTHELEAASGGGGGVIGQKGGIRPMRGFGLLR